MHKLYAVYTILTALHRLREHIFSQGRQKLPRDGAAIGSDIRGRAVADSVSVQHEKVFRLFCSAVKKLFS